MVTCRGSKCPPENNCLVLSTPLKNMNVNWDDDIPIIPNIWENKKCSKPPTRTMFSTRIQNVVPPLYRQWTHNLAMARGESAVWSQSNPAKTQEIPGAQGRSSFQPSPSIGILGSIMLHIYDMYCRQWQNPDWHSCKSTIPAKYTHYVLLTLVTGQRPQARSHYAPFRRDTRSLDPRVLPLAQGTWESNFLLPSGSPGALHFVRLVVEPPP